MAEKGFEKALAPDHYIERQLLKKDLLIDGSAPIRAIFS